MVLRLELALGHRLFVGLLHLFEDAHEFSLHLVARLDVRKRLEIGGHLLQHVFHQLLLLLQFLRRGEILGPELVLARHILALLDHVALDGRELVELLFHLLGVLAQVIRILFGLGELPLIEQLDHLGEIIDDALLSLAGRRELLALELFGGTEHILIDFEFPEHRRDFSQPLAKILVADGGILAIRIDRLAHGCGLFGKRILLVGKFGRRGLSGSLGFLAHEVALFLEQIFDAGDYFGDERLLRVVFDGGGHALKPGHDYGFKLDGRGEKVGVRLGGGRGAGVVQGDDRILDLLLRERLQFATHIRRDEISGAG